MQLTGTTYKELATIQGIGPNRVRVLLHDWSPPGKLSRKRLDAMVKYLKLKAKKMLRYL